MIGVGAMIGAGIFVLTGIAAGESGPASILAFALNGVVTLLTAFAYAELASAIPRAGGGYSFVRRSPGRAATNTQPSAPSSTVTWTSSPFATRLPRATKSI